MKRHIRLILLSATGLATAAGVAYAADAGLEPDARHVAAAKVSMAQAVTTAEQHVQGKATRAEFEIRGRGGRTTWKS